MSDQPTQQDFYEMGGMQADVNPFQQKDSEANLIINFYSHKALAKKVRYGYTKFLDNIDGSPVRNLIFYQFPTGSGILRVSGMNTYLANTSTGTWGSPISGLSWSVDRKIGTTTLSGEENYVHLSNSVDGYHTWDGTTAKHVTGSFTPSSTYLTTYNSRVLGDINLLSLAESWVSFDLNTQPTITINDPTGNGALVELTADLQSGSITGYIIDSGGSGYTSPTATISAPNDPNGVQATATATESGGVITSISITNAGSGYDDPFSYNSQSADPEQGGTTSIDNGANGAMVGLSVVQNCALIYRQRAVYRFDGTNFIALNFANSVIPNSICTSDYTKTDYFVSYNSIYSCDAQKTPPASFGINTIIQDTFLKTGLPNPISFAFDYQTFFYFGNIWYVDYSGKGTMITNAMFVHDERFNEWVIWSIGHNITAFGSYTDSNNVRHMLTGDDKGNTYVWGEQYTSDNGTAIDYLLRTKYINNQIPSGTKVPQPQFAVVSDPTNECTVSMAKDFSEVFREIGPLTSRFSKFNNILFPHYKNASIEFKGSTTTGGPEIYGWTMNMDEEEHFTDYKTSRSGRK
jgi:hypothetical protein